MPPEYEHYYTDALIVYQLHNLSFALHVGLEKYTDHMVSVAAATSSGSGPFSSPVTVKTLEDRK